MVCTRHHILVPLGALQRSAEYILKIMTLLSARVGTV
jgi:hypothetical protein